MSTWSAPWNTPQPVSPEVVEAPKETPAPEVIAEPVVEEPKKTTKKTNRISSSSCKCSSKKSRSFCS